MTAQAVSPNRMADAIRVLAMDAVERANSGHPGMPMGMADAATVLWTRFLKYDPADPAWPDRDRFVLSAGHGSMLLYSLLYLSGVPGVSIDDLKNFRQLGSNTPGHPEYGETPGVETTTGPLGQGVATAVGMALAERLLNARYGDDLVDHRTWVIASDGDLMEGISHEAISIAGHLRLSRLTVLFDDNHITIDGDLSLSESGDMRKRFEAAGWATDAVDGHDMDAVAQALVRAKASDRPTLIACRTIIGKGAPNKANSHDCHGAALGKDEVAATRAALDWPHAEFDMPQDILDAWRGAFGAPKAAHRDWTERFAHSPRRAAFEAAIRGQLPAGWRDAIRAHAAKMAETAPAMATRQSSGAALEVLAPAIPQLIGGSADLTGSNNTKVKGMQSVTAEDFSGRYVNYGVREHGMAAAMNGMALHGGFIPYSGTFLAFADYCRPAIRLAALMRQRVIHVMTHDSIGLGEDGPTHQPVEHLASLRAMPNVAVFRPADAVEAAECWEAALDNTTGPSVMALSRQKLPALRTASDENLSARGAYVLKSGANGVAEQVVLLATGSEVHIAVKAAEMLVADGIGARVVSMPCWELFEAQDAAYRAAVLGGALPKVAVEAAVRFGWERWVGENGTGVGMKGFGASAPADQLYKHFGITPEAVADAAKGLL
jgi:transketolase